MTPFVAEVVGTALLILLGNGVVANCVLKGTKGHNGGWIVITTAWAFAVFVGVVVAGPISGAHLNPAVTVGLATAGKFAWADAPLYIVAQLIGAIIGAFIVWVFHKDHFAITDDEGAKRACFCTEPAICNFPSNLFSEVVGTFVLVFVIFYLVSDANIAFPGADIDPDTGKAITTPIGLGSIGALPVAILVWVIGLSLGGTTGYAINPARDAGPRIVLTILSGKLNAKPDWAYGIVPIVGPIVGAILAALAACCLA
ncbi:MIP/aquaporin family protein [Suttonella ornithocola]|uniref:Glyceroaquaporin n=1 Tax=Suttonella ornithocola TaxID=279832 RepID=A0A380N1V9_9GAMM|nr:MIP/aquaporin family protein [Suttonella ornithocola]SUO97747.1 Glyceroaquaporin [Suttonella ornithocola]